MAKKKTGEKKLLFVLFTVLIIAIGLVAIFKLYTNIKTPNTSQVSSETALLVDAAVWYPSAPWTEPSSTTEETPYGTLTGEKISATVTSPNPMIDHFEMVPELTKKGFEPDNMLAADGPGSSMWGYKKVQNGKTQILTFSYKTQPTNSNPNQPLEFNCPCKIDITVFASNPFNSTLPEN